MRQWCAWEVLLQPQLNQPHFRKPAKIYKPRGRTIMLCKSWQTTDLITLSPRRDRGSLASQTNRIDALPVGPTGLVRGEHTYCCLGATVLTASLGTRRHSAVLSFPFTCCSDFQTNLELNISYSFPLPKGPCTLLGLTEPGNSHAGNSLSSATWQVQDPCRSHNREGCYKASRKRCYKEAGRNNQGDSGGQTRTKRALTAG